VARSVREKTKPNQPFLTISNFTIQDFQNWLVLEFSPERPHIIWYDFNSKYFTLIFVLCVLNLSCTASSYI